MALPPHLFCQQNTSCIDKKDAGKAPAGNSERQPHHKAEIIRAFVYDGTLYTYMCLEDTDQPITRAEAKIGTKVFPASTRLETVRQAGPPVTWLPSVDDIEVNRIILIKILSSLGASCDSANSGQEAIDKFEASQPGEYDLILMDLQMPVLDGCGAARAIRVCDHPSAKSIPIIAITANAFADDVRAALEAGINAHPAKPIQTDQLKSVLRQVLDGQEETGGNSPQHGHGA